MGSDKRRLPPNGYVLHRAREGLNASNFMIFLSAPNASTLEPKPMERSPHPNCRVAERCNELFYHIFICTSAARNAVKALRFKIHIPSCSLGVWSYPFHEKRPPFPLLIGNGAPERLFYAVFHKSK